MNKEKILLVLGTAVLAGGLVWLGFLLNKPGTIINQVGEKLGAVANIRDVGPEFGMNGLQTAVVSGNFVDATTTIVSIANPFPATGTVSWIGLFNTGVATSSYRIGCGTSKQASAARSTSAPGNEFTLTPDVATSTIFSQVIKLATSTQIIGKGEYLLCVVHGVSSADAQYGDNTWDSAFTNNGNTFTGKVWAEFRGLIQ